MDILRKRNVLFLLRSAWEIRKSLFLFYVLNIVFALASSLAAIIAPRELVSALINKVDSSEIIKIASLFFAVSGFSGFFLAYIKSFIVGNLHEIRMVHSHKISMKLLSMDYGTYEDSDFLNKKWIIQSVANNFTTGVQGVLMRLFQVSAYIVTISFYFWILFKLSLWVVLFLAVNIIVMFLATFYSYKFSLKIQEERSPFDRKSRYLNRTFNDFMYGKDIRIFGLSNWLIGLYKKNFRKQNDYTKKVETRNYQVSNLNVILSLARDILVYSVMVYSVINGRIGIADFSMYFMAIASFTIIIQELSTDIAFIYSQGERLSEYRNFLELPDEAAESGSLPIPKPIPDGYEIEFKEVWFKYPKTEKYIYKNLNLKINAGEKLAIVGLNGAGKTTLIKLIIRLYKPERGEILLNGVNIRDMDLFEYRGIISAVFQEITLYATTLAENITLECSKPNEAKLMDAMKKSGFYENFQTHEKGMDTQVLKYIHEEGVDFSGGEKQKVAITRALYKDGPILILDEPTAALDAVAEYSLYHELSEISRNKTVIFVSHRLASTRFCDKIVLVEDSGIKEMGTHDELMKLKGAYCNMFNTQMQYYKEVGDLDA